MGLTWIDHEYIDKPVERNDREGKWVWSEWKSENGAGIGARKRCVCCGGGGEGKKGSGEGDSCVRKVGKVRQNKENKKR